MLENRNEMPEEKNVDIWKCPVCGSRNIDAYDESSSDEEVLEHYSCADCDSRWDVLYVVDSIINVEDGRDR